ncbi:hypothetical protein [Oryzibacter oryziterrae]|uniref:hypothetical protein n=1 Tax=Oryzibacter oryziterrae TaxID=2766474 RepID=UPI001F28D483|nr:hypothetical protein [Oryzibacter oryziterrae]
MKMFNSGDGSVQTPNEKAEFIGRMSQELSRLANGAGFPFLAFILDMAAEEAALSRSSNRLQVRSKQGENVDIQRLITR